jgi:hypothetical protein
MARCVPRVFSGFCETVLGEANREIPVDAKDRATVHPPQVDVGIVLSLGTTDRYCAPFGGDESRNDATLTDAPAPAACPQERPQPCGGETLCEPSA